MKESKLLLQTQQRPDSKQTKPIGHAPTAPAGKHGKRMSSLSPFQEKQLIGRTIPRQPLVHPLATHQTHPLTLLSPLQLPRHRRPLPPAPLHIHSHHERQRHRNQDGQKHKRRPNLAVAIRNRADDSRPENTRPLIRDGIQGVKRSLGARRDEFAEEAAAVAGQATEDEAVEGAEREHFPRLLEAEDAEAADGGDVAEEAVQGDEFEEGEAGDDGLGRAEAEAAGEGGPGEGAEDAGEGGDDVDEGERGGFHLQLGLGEEDGGAGDGGDGVAEEQPGAEEEHDVAEVPRAQDRFPERAPGVDEVAGPEARTAGKVMGVDGGESRAGTGSEPDGGWDGKDEPPGTDDEQDEAEGESGGTGGDNDKDGKGLYEHRRGVADADAVGRDLRRKLKFGRS